ncbi:hypothetical protein [Nocardia nova]|uniref:hypothetical protein n=1 Tax=Nocardia nova TaxID=37330 RepID=UPI0033E69AF4
MTDPFSEMSPDEVAKMTERLEFTDEPVEPIEAGPDAEKVLVPTSVKLPRGLAKKCKKRAKDLGMASQSAYIVSLIERDIAEAGTGGQRPPWVTELLAVIAHNENDEHRKAS